MIQTYINQINEALRENIGAYEAKINPLAQPVYIVDEDEKMIPCVTINGEDTDVFIDDDFDFGFYHKQRGISYVENTTRGYGDKKETTEIQDLSLIVWGFENKLTAEEFKDFFIKNKPNFVRLQNIIIDKKTVFNSEFKGVDFTINESIFFIQINYRVQYIVKSECLEINEKFNN